MYVGRYDTLRFTGKKLLGFKRYDIELVNFSIAVNKSIVMGFINLLFLITRL